MAIFVWLSRLHCKRTVLLVPLVLTESSVCAVLNAPYPAGRYVLGAFLFSSFIINLLGAAQTRPEAKLRTVFSEFK